MKETFSVDKKQINDNIAVFERNINRRELYRIFLTKNLLYKI